MLLEYGISRHFSSLESLDFQAGEAGLVACILMFTLLGRTKGSAWRPPSPPWAVRLIETILEEWEGQCRRQTGRLVFYFILLSTSRWISRLKVHYVVFRGAWGFPVKSIFHTYFIPLHWMIYWAGACLLCWNWYQRCKSQAMYINDRCGLKLSIMCQIINNS